MKRISSYLFVFLFIIAGCSSEKELASVAVIDQEATNSVKQTIKMPKDMPSTFDFMVRYGYGTANKNEINTFQGTITKDLIANGTATTPMKFTKEELRSIYNKMREMDIMSEKKLETEVKGCETVPYNEDIWEVNVNGNTVTMSWTDRYCSQTVEAEQLLELRQFVELIVQERTEYQNLPESEGGYE
ncbi:hypothetical protein AB4Z29_15010 [Paenibacillus sp. 2TAB23]|uniref:hypothetical protein n=1 Tax=Paenibacillus sp. 2TAB23 TaxID=3233004 RepID=UPI003F96628E